MNTQLTPDQYGQHPDEFYSLSEGEIFAGYTYGRMPAPHELDKWGNFDVDAWLEREGLTGLYVEDVDCTDKEKAVEVINNTSKHQQIADLTDAIYKGDHYPDYGPTVETNPIIHKNRKNHGNRNS